MTLNTRHIFALAALICAIIGIVFAVRALTTAQHLVTNVGAGAAQAAQQISTTEQQMSTTAHPTLTLPIGSKCRPKGGGSGVVVQSPSGPYCVPQG